MQWLQCSQDTVLTVSQLICQKGPLTQPARFQPRVIILFQRVPRFITDSNLGGVERLTVCLPVTGTMHSTPGLKASDVASSPDADALVGPCSLLMVKGWTRAVSAMCVLSHCWEDQEFLKASFSLLRCHVCQTLISNT